MTCCDFIDYSDRDESLLPVLDFQTVTLSNIESVKLIVPVDQEEHVEEGDKWHLAFNLPNSDIILKFKTEVVHSQVNRVGVKFVDMDIDTMTHLHGLLEARPANPQRRSNRFACMT